VVGALESATAVRLPPVLAVYAAACPEVDIEIATGTSAELVEAVLARRVEAAFVAGPVAHNELTALRLLEEELVLVTAPWVASLEHLRVHADGRRLKVIVFRAGCTYRQHLEAVLAAHGIVNVGRLEFGTLDGILGCVGAGIGITLLPRAVAARTAAEGRVALHPLAHGGRVETVLVRFIETAQRELAPRAAARRSARPATAATPRSSARASAAASAPRANRSA